MTDYECFDRPDEHREPVFDQEHVDDGYAASDGVVSDEQVDGVVDIDDNGLEQDRPEPIIVEMEPIEAGDDVFDTYEDFDALFPPEVRDRIADAALEAARQTQPEISEDDLLISGFGEAPTAESLAATDEHKLAVRSNASKGLHVGEELDGLETDTQHGFDGDDSNLSNIAERDIQGLRDEKLHIARQLSEAEASGGISESARAAAAARLAELNRQIGSMQTDQAAQSATPVYYATKLSEVRGDLPEDNPLAYLGEVPGRGHLAVYDRRALVAAGIPISEKSPEQIRIAAHGAELMRHCVALIPLQIGEEE